jgi:hypothetical protein
VPPRWTCLSSRCDYDTSKDMSTAKGGLHGTPERWKCLCQRLDNFYFIEKTQKSWEKSENKESEKESKMQAVVWTRSRSRLVSQNSGAAWSRLGVESVPSDHSVE